MSESKSIDKTRNFCTLVYPESAPSDWFDILEMTHVATFVSPLHDKDIDSDGNPKKPHYHVMLMFDNTKTSQRVRKITESFGGVGLEMVDSVSGMARYLCHIDNPDKVRYNEADVKELSGADYLDVISLSDDKYNTISDILEFCECNDVVSFWELVTYSRIHKKRWFRLLMSTSGRSICDTLKSKEWTERTQSYSRIWVDKDSQK